MSKSKRREMEAAEAAAAAVEAEVVEEKTVKKTTKKKVEEVVKEEKIPAKKSVEKVEKPAAKKTTEKAEEKPTEKAVEKAEKKPAKASSGELFERKLKTMTTKELTEALYEYTHISFEWQTRANEYFDDHDQKIDDHEKRIKALEDAKPEEPKPVEPVKPVKSEEPKPEPAKVQVQPLVKNEPKLEGIRFPYADGPCSKLWLWWNAETKEWCGPTDIHTADKLSAKVPEKAFVWLKDGYVMRNLTDKEIAEYFG